MMKGYFKKSMALVLALVMVLSVFVGAQAATATDATGATFTVVEENFDDATIFDGGELTATYDATVQNGVLYFPHGGDSTTNSKKIEIGDANFKNYVVTADVYFSQVPGVTTNTGTGLLQIYAANTLLYRFEARYDRDSSNVTNDDSATNVALSRQKGDEITAEKTAAQLVAAPAADRPFKVRIEAVNNTFKLSATYEYEDGVVTEITNAVSGVTTTGVLQLKSGNNAGLVIQVDNLKVALLDTVTGGVTGFSNPPSVVATGTADTALGISYGTQVDVFGAPVLLKAGTATIASDGYDTSKPGVRKVTATANGASKTFEVAYTSDTSKYFDEDFSKNFFRNDSSVTHNNIYWKQSDSTKAYIKDGALNLKGGNVIIGKNTWNGYVMEADFKIAPPAVGEQAPYSALLYFSVLNGSTTAASNQFDIGFQVTFKTDDDKNNTSSDFNTVGLNTNNRTGLTATETKHNRTYSTSSDILRHIRIESTATKITVSYKEGAETDWTVIDEISYANKNGTLYLNSNRAYLNFTVENMTVRPITDENIQTAYGLSLKAGEEVLYNDAAKTFNTFDLVQSFYGFAADEVVSSADATVEYLGNNQAKITYNGLECTVPCTVTEIASIVADTQAVKLGDDLVITGVTNLGDKVTLADATITGYNKNQAGRQTVSVAYGDVNAQIEVIVLNYNDILFFENFSAYGEGVSPWVNDATQVDGAVIKWNDNNAANPDNNDSVVINGQLQATEPISTIINPGATTIAEGVLGVDMKFPADDHDGKYYYSGLLKSDKSKSFVTDNELNIAYGIEFNTEDLTATKLCIYIGEPGKTTEERILDSASFEDFELDTTYRFEMRIYGNTIRGYVDGKEVVAYTAAKGTAAYAAITSGNAQWGVNVSRTGRYGALKGIADAGANPQGAKVLVDNVAFGTFDTYAITDATNGVVTLYPTKAQSGEFVYLNANVNKNDVLSYSDGTSTKGIYISKAMYDESQGVTTWGGEGTAYGFSMPAANVTINAGDNTLTGGYDVATFATDYKPAEGTSKAALRFLSRIYLPATADGNALDLGSITKFGAYIVRQKDLDATGLDAEAYINTYVGATTGYKVADGVAYEQDVKSVLYDITGKYADYVVKITTSDPTMTFVCVPYVVVDGQTILGEPMDESINSYLGK